MNNKHKNCTWARPFPLAFTGILMSIINYFGFNFHHFFPNAYAWCLSKGLIWSYPRWFSLSVQWFLIITPAIFFLGIAIVMTFKSSICND